jgi:DNA repair protein RecO (recombination protein O)
MIEKTEAIVLHTRKFGDTSKIVNLYTKDYGKITVIAKGVRKAKSKFSASLEPLSYIEIKFYHKPNRDLHVLAEADIIVPYRKISTSFDHTGAALLIAESVLITQELNAPHVELFDFFRLILEDLNSLPKSPYTYFVSFGIHLAIELGFEFDPHILEDLELFRLGKSLCKFSLDSGRLLEEPNFASNYITIEKETYIKLYYIFILEHSKISEIELTDKEAGELVDFFTRYFAYHLDKKVFFKSKQLFLK